MIAGDRATLAKVPALTVVFWATKILATTLGETLGDTASMSLNLGYLVGSGIFFAILVLLVWRQVAASRYRPALYWATIIASTTAGTTLADFATRSLGIGYAGGSLVLFAGVAISLILWHRTLGSVSIETVHEPRAELFYWLTITVSQTLGTALGDWTADSGGLGYGGAAILFAVMLTGIAGLYFLTTVNRALLFWSAFILTRPLGAAIGDFLDKPIDHGGLAFSRPLASGVLLAAIGLLVAIWPSYPGSRRPSAPPITEPG